MQITKEVARCHVILASSDTFLTEWLEDSKHSMIALCGQPLQELDTQPYQCPLVSCCWSGAAEIPLQRYIPLQK